MIQDVSHENKANIESNLGGVDAQVQHIIYFNNRRDY
jgi:hypothetical protein